MKKFRIRQEVSVTEENGAPIKEILIDTWVSTEGISENSVKDMFRVFSDGFTKLLEDVSFKNNKIEEFEFTSSDVGKGW